MSEIDNKFIVKTYIVKKYNGLGGNIVATLASVTKLYKTECLIS